ncbi:MAG: tetratricopeptide repeat protein [Planctomycetes bacterium]|nr:tetratricopeptide repeat protein [Planctomycetota bacterium]
MTSHRRFILIAALTVAFVAALGSPVAWRRWNDHRRSQLTRLCRTARQSQRWEDLQDLADDWTRWDPQNGDAWMQRGIAASARQAWGDAAESFWRIPDSDPQAIPAMIELSKLAFTHLNDPLKGVEACERILRIDPRTPGARQQLIWFYAMTLQRAKLLQQIREAIELQSEPREAYVYYFLLYSLRSQDAVDLNTRWLQATPDSELFLVARVINQPDPQSESPETPATLPAATESRGELSTKSKLDQVQELVIRFPHNLELIAYQAEERLTNGDVSAAAAILKNAPESAAQDGRFWRFKGWLHESNNELDAAVAAYRRALELHPVDWNAMNRLAIVERRRQNLSEVEKLTNLVERENEARKNLRQQKVETPSLQILQELAGLFRDCGNQEFAVALERRLTGTRRR